MSFFLSLLFELTRTRLAHQRYTHVFNIIIIAVDGIPFSHPQMTRSFCCRCARVFMLRRRLPTTKKVRWATIHPLRLFQVTLPSDFIEMIRQFPTHNRRNLTCNSDAQQIQQILHICIAVAVAACVHSISLWQKHDVALDTKSQARKTTTKIHFEWL